MKINEVASKTKITKKNIRFYEEQKLLNPKRNVENGYREYSEEDVRMLQQIKLMRKLGVSIEEIRQMLSGQHTVGDGMQRHLIALEREKQNTEQAMMMCQRLKTVNAFLGDFDPEEILKEMENMESAGTTFKNKQQEDVRVQYMVPILISTLVIAFIICMITLVIWDYHSTPEEAPPLALIIIGIGILSLIGVGVVMALFQRIKEIGKGEVNDARKY